MRPVADTSLPDNCAMIRSTGPPGMNCVTAKVISMMPSSVGMMSSTRFNR
jgi:hypothetical protein